MTEEIKCSCGELFCNEVVGDALDTVIMFGNASIQHALAETVMGDGSMKTNMCYVMTVYGMQNRPKAGAPKVPTVETYALSESDLQNLIRLFVQALGPEGQLRLIQMARGQN